MGSTTSNEAEERMEEIVDKDVMVEYTKRVELQMLEELGVGRRYE